MKTFFSVEEQKPLRVIGFDLIIGFLLQVNVLKYGVNVLN